MCKSDKKEKRHMTVLALDEDADGQEMLGELVRDYQITGHYLYDTLKYSS